MDISWQISGESSIREIDEKLQRLYDRRIELFTILITSIIVAFLVNILTLPLEAFVERVMQVLGMPREAIYMLLILLLIICILTISHFYYGKPIIFRWGTFLLLNKEHGIIYPSHVSVEYSVIGTLALQAYLREANGSLLNEKEFSLDNPLLRDLLEVFIVDWLVSTTINKFELLSGFSKPKIRYPKLGKRYKTWKTRDILAKFGENRFAKYIDKNHTIMLTEIKIPERLNITCQRYKNSIIDLEADEESIRPPLASELRIEGSRFTPLKKIRIIAYVSGITLGEKWILLTHGLRPLTIGPETIECVDRNGRRVIISGEKRKELSSWLEIDFDVIISAEVRPFFFFHPKFGEVLDWVRQLYLRAVDYFSPKLNIWIKTRS